VEFSEGGNTIDAQLLDKWDIKIRGVGD